MSLGDALFIGLLLGGGVYAYRRHQSANTASDAVYKVTRRAPDDSPTEFANLISAGVNALSTAFTPNVGRTAPPEQRGEVLQLPGLDVRLPQLTFPGGRPAPGVVGSPPSVQPPAPVSSIGERLTRDLMRDFGFTRFQAAGFVGNLHHESAGFQSLQEISPFAYDDKGNLVRSSTARGGYGYAQWTGPRRREFEEWAFARGLAYDSYEANYGFLKHELQNTSERRVVARLRASSSVEQAAEIVMSVFLRPGIEHFDSRLRAAREYA